jgi:hypothetical protein
MARIERRKSWWMMWKRKSMLCVGSGTDSEAEENQFYQRSCRRCDEHEA